MFDSTTRLAAPILLLLAACASPASEQGIDAPALPTVNEPPLPDGAQQPPYSAAQIAGSHPAGTFTLYRVDAGPGSTFQRTEWIVSTAEGCSMRMTSQDASGAEAAPPVSASAEWWELRNHAAVPAAATTVRDEAVEIEAGRFDCWLFEVASDQGTQRMWFDKRSAGSPVLMTQEVGGAEVMRMELVETNRLPLEAN